MSDGSYQTMPERHRERCTVVPTKLTDYSYMVEKKEGMHVPVKIFASEKLLQKMLEDNCIQQGINVAGLPGIKGWSIMMPDAHQGYGFSIGGVAAIDVKDGCISPGGIGFDINCLTKDNLILSSYGYVKPIQEYEPDFIEVEHAHDQYTLKSLKMRQSLMSFNQETKIITGKTPAYFMKRKYCGSVLQITSQLGNSITVTNEHPILTKQGMIKAGSLRKGDELAVYPFKGVTYEEPEHLLLVDEIFTPEINRELKERGLLPLSLNNPKLPLLLKLFGYLLGDGSIYLSGKKGFVNAYGTEEDLLDIQKDISELGFSAKIYARTRDHTIPTRYGTVEFTAENCELHTSSKALAKLFFALGYPQGRKTITPHLIPEWIMQSPLWMKRLFLSGFFGAELSSPRTHTKTGFDCPTLSINKNSTALETGRFFAIQLMQLLESFGVETHHLHQSKDFMNQHGATERLRVFISSEEENLLRLWGTIGFSYNKKREQLSHIALLYIQEKKELTLQRKKMALSTKDLKNKGLTLKEVQKVLTSSLVNDRFIERHYYGSAGQRISLTFSSFNDYVVTKQKELETFGCFFDTISTITKKAYDDEVYDFNIPETHSFIAGNIVVSNCGVRLLATNLKKEQVYEKIRPLLDSLFHHIPPGVGEKSKFKLTNQELDVVLKEGAHWAVRSGYGTQEDLDNCEENGCLAAAEPSLISDRAKARGRGQLGTLGSGNHFIEIQYVHKIFDKKTADVFGIHHEGQIVVMIHCGSRGLGHQVCSDFLRKMEDAYPEIIAKLPEKDLIYAPAESAIAKDYFKAMCAAANFAWANRHMIGHQARVAFTEVFGQETTLQTVYDVAHNIAKLETYEIDGKESELWIHRKGATRAFGPHRKEIPAKYQETGQPILIPGSMGTSSYVLVGTEKARYESFASTAHGAGRAMSRFKANQMWRGEKLKADLEKEQIYIKAASWKGITEEAPLAYKDVDEVVRVSDQAGIGTIVAQLKPIGVVKG